ncbi:MAG: hypothetical protein ACYC6F_08875 [Longimicrobiales bacterium]
MDIRDQTPKARTDGLLVEELDGETLVYDLETHGAHCLNPAAALVWKRSDGRTPVRDLIPLLREVGLPAEESVVWMALSRLDDAGLVEGVTLPGKRALFSRKEVLRVLGATAAMTLLLPAVESVVAPLAAQTASCITLATCTALKPPNCTGLPICTDRTKCCKTSGKRCTALRC